MEQSTAEPVALALTYKPRKQLMNIRKVLGLAAVVGLISVAAPIGQANAVSLANPGVANSAKYASEGMTTDVRWRRGRGYHRHYGWRPRYHRRRW